MVTESHILPTTQPKDWDAKSPWPSFNFARLYDTIPPNDHAEWQKLCALFLEMLEEYQTVYAKSIFFRNEAAIAGLVHKYNATLNLVDGQALANEANYGRSLLANYDIYEDALALSVKKMYKLCQQFAAQTAQFQQKRSIF